MQEENAEIVHIEQTGFDIIQASQKAEIDMQISTAKAFPRNIRKSKENMIAVVTMDKETAQSCNYALPRAGKNIMGKSVHLARIVTQCWGNIRAESRIIGADQTHVTSEAVCFDLENNVAVKVSVKRRITDKYGKRFNDDMITVTGNAASSIAYRNAVFNVVPSGITDSVYKEAMRFLTGDLSDESKLIARRKKALDHFADDWKINEEQLLQMLGLRSINQIKQDEIVALIGISNSLKDGDTTVEELLSDVNTKIKTKETEKALIPETGDKANTEQPKAKDESVKTEQSEPSKKEKTETKKTDKTEKKQEEQSNTLFKANTDFDKEDN